MLDNIFLQLSVLLGITVSIAFVMRLLRQPLLVAYIVAGIVAGPMFLNLLEREGQTFDALAEFGVVLLLFVVGLSLNLEHIKKIGAVSAIAGVAQTLFTAAIGYLILIALGFPNVSAIYLSVAITFSSTIVIHKLLSDKKDTETVYGRYTIGLMIVQDIIAIAIMMVVTSVRDAASLGIELAQLTAKMVALAAFVFLASRFIVPRILTSIAKSGEFLFIFTIAWCFGIASALYRLGFSLEIGAVVAGLSLGSSPFHAEIASRIKPLRDFFIILFFIILGSEMSLTRFTDVLAPGLILSLFILLGNPFILYWTFRMLNFTRRNSFLAGITAAQVSEFGFVLLFVGRGLGHITGPEIEIFTIVGLTTILLSSYAITYSEQLYRLFMPMFRLFGKDHAQQAEQKETMYDVFVVGYHRIGWKVCEALAEKKISFAVVDYNPEAVARLDKRGIPSFFGDAADVEFLETLPLDTAKLIVLTIPAPDDQVTFIQHARKRNPKILVIANLYHSSFLEELYAAGANYVMMPHLLGGSWIATVLKEKPWNARTFDALKKEQKEEMKLRFTTGANDHGLHPTH